MTERFGSTLLIAVSGVHQRAEDWVVVLAWISLGIAFACAFAVLTDIFIRGYRQKMGIMNAVWPITCLYFGPFALWFYWARGRKKSPKYQEEHPDDEEKLGRQVLGSPWWATSKGVAHCGAGCTLGDIIGHWTIFIVGWTIPIFGYFAANELMAMYVADFVLAWSLGIVFQYFTIVPMREGLSGLEGVWEAIKADTLSIVSFQAGLFAWMALAHLVFWRPPLMVDSPEAWFMMQIGMVIGYFTSWPVNAWLIKQGIKEKM